MEILGLVLVGSLLSAAILFFCGLYYSVSGSSKWTKFMAFGLLNLAASCWIVLYYGSSQISLSQIGSLIIASFVFIGFSGLFYWSYQLNQKK